MTDLMKRRVVSAVVLGAISAFSLGQTPAPQAPAPTPATPPAVAEVLQLKAELATAAEQLALARAEAAICRGQLAPATFQTQRQEVAAVRAKLVAEFEKTNPGWTIDPVTLTVAPKKGGGG